MGPFLFVSAIFIMYSYQMQGSSAVTPVFVQKGEDVTLNLMTADVPENFIFVSWTLNKKINIITFFPNKQIISDRYTARVEFAEGKFSVTLKNLQEADSGVYTAQVKGMETEETVAVYVTVQDPVSPVELKVDSANSSASCNLTVTCSTQDYHISCTFTCDTNTCSQEGGERSEVTTSGASLRVYLVNDSVICNHSNQVSWTKVMMEIQRFCPRGAGLELPRNHITVVCIIVAVSIVVLLAPVCYCRKRKKNGRPSDHQAIDNTVYATPQVEATAQPQDTAASPATIYSAVKPHTGSMGSTEPTGRTLPDSLYAQVERSGRP